MLTNARLLNYLSGMHIVMSFQTSFLIEAYSTDITTEGFISCVHTYMHIKIVVARESLPTYGTFAA